MLEGAKFLKYFNIGHNSITDITPVALSSLRSLYTLIINDNQISHIAAGTFKQQNQLRLLNLAGNKLDQIQAKMFLGLDNLEDLNMNNNLLKSLNSQNLTELSKISTISVRHNKFNTLDLKIVDHLYQLKNVDVSSNQISRVIFPTVAWRKLHFLSLADNVITSLPFNITNVLSKRGQIHLYENPWHCNCDISWMISEYPRINVVHLARPNDIVCKSPWNFNGEKIRKLKVDEVCATDVGSDDPDITALSQQFSQLGCSFSTLADNKKENIRNNKEDSLPWIVNLFNTETKEKLCDGVRLTPFHILTDTLCVKHYNLEEDQNVKICFGNSKYPSQLYETRVTGISHFFGPLDVTIVKLQEVEEIYKTLVFPCILNNAGLEFVTKKRHIHGIIPSSLKRSKYNGDMKIHMFAAHTIRKPCIPGYICLQVNSEKFKGKKYKERNLPVFFKVGRSRWALGGFGDVKGYGNILASPTEKALDWIERILQNM